MPLGESDSDDERGPCVWSDEESEDESDYQEEKDDAAKVAYLKAAIKDEVEFENKKSLDKDVLEAIEWTRGKSAQVVKNERENIMSAIERMGEQLKEMGASGNGERLTCANACVQQFDCLGFARQKQIPDPKVRKISSGVNGPLLEALIERADYGDKTVLDLFTKGAPVVGELER